MPLGLVELPSRPVGPNDVRVRVRSIGVNPVDWKMRDGGHLGVAYKIVGPAGPLVVGVDFAGEVTEVGASADLAVGARVVGGTDFSRKQFGSYADEVVVRADQCCVLPDAVSFDDAACLPVAAVTPWRALTEIAHLDRKPKSRVLVLGASGGVGLMAIQLARQVGASAVGVCSGRNTALVERLGAVAVDYTKGDALEAARAHGPYELVVHAVGTDLYPLGKCRSLLTPTGVVVLVVIRGADLFAVGFLPSVASVLGRPNRATLEPIVAALARGELACLIEEKFPLAKAEAAHAASRKGKVVGKLLLEP
jgi:NADPH:quinone reductase-like Zn-dependent oxidoreductase